MDCRSSSDEITTDAALQKLLREADTASSILRTPGHRFAGVGERERIAQLLSTMAAVVRRADSALRAQRVRP